MTCELRVTRQTLRPDGYRSEPCNPGTVVSLGMGTTAEG